MYNTDTEIKLEGEELTAGKLVEIFSNMNPSTEVVITGENYCYIMTEEDGSVVNIDVIDADSINN
jgi:hypothetical protein